MTILKYRAAALAMSCAALLSACGGGGGGGTPPWGGSTPETPDASTTASSLLMTLSQASIQNGTVTPVTATVTAVNSRGQTLSNVPVTFEVSGALFSTAGAVTGTDGKLAASVDVTNKKDNRVVTIKATSGSVSVTKNLVVSGVKVAATPNPAIILPGNSGTIEFTVQDANSDPIDDMAVTVNSPFGSTSSSARTDASGKYTYSYSVPSNYGGSEFIATISAGGVSYNQTVVVQQGGGGVTIPPATSVSTRRVEINPSVVGTNTGGSTSQSATVRFKAFGPTSLPVPNVRVSFDLAGDPSAIGGTLTSGSGVVYTDSNGIATTTYIPGPTATSTTGLTIRACYSSTDFTPSSSGNATSGTAACPASSTEQIVINNEALNVTIGPDDTISETADGLRYLVKYVVQVVNASGQAKENVTITPTLDIIGFEKGRFEYDDANSKWVQLVTSTGTYQDLDTPSISYDGCANEDLNRNGINDVGEDRDGDGVLEPRKSDVAISFVEAGVNRTDATGAVALQITYLKNVAQWGRIKIYVKGAVSGTEGVGTFETVLPAPTTVINREATPAFATNPYGNAASCTAH
ncbi:MAG: hypothetical protein WAQ08_06485 [Aquabacterium sp.]|uniref:hypothetical protein n=1 Tax=Aquabacterium sp. TaxID=1872578 RepID=UPI003BAF1861